MLNPQTAPAQQPSARTAGAPPGAAYVSFSAASPQSLTIRNNLQPFGLGATIMLVSRARAGAQGTMLTDTAAPVSSPWFLGHAQVRRTSAASVSGVARRN